jgi:hypothetical protein
VPVAAPSYARDIRPLFTQLDRDHMKKALDLWSYDDARAWGERIYDAVKRGAMPPHGSEPEAPWPPEKVALVRAWIDGGYQP